MSASTQVTSVVTCPSCKRVTNIYKHIALGYTSVSVYHVVACQLCGTELYIVTVMNGAILPHDQLKAKLLHPSREQSGMSAETGALAERRGRLP